MLLARGTMQEGDRHSVGARWHADGSSGQLITESMLLAIAGAGVGLLLSFWTTSFAVSSLASILPLSIVFQTTPDLNIMLALRVRRDSRPCSPVSGQH